MTQFPATFPQPQPFARQWPVDLVFRGTRIFAALVLGFAGVLFTSFGYLAATTPIEVGGGLRDPDLHGLLATLAWPLIVLGITHIVAAVGVARDRIWGLRTALWAFSLGLLVVLGSLVVGFAGRDPIAVLDPLARPTGVGVLLWTLLWYGLLGWALRRVIEARRLLAGRVGD